MSCKCPPSAPSSTDCPFAAVWSLWPPTSQTVTNPLSICQTPLKNEAQRHFDIVPAYKNSQSGHTKRLYLIRSNKTCTRQVPRSWGEASLGSTCSRQRGPGLWGEATQRLPSMKGGQAWRSRGSSAPPNRLIPLPRLTRLFPYREVSVGSGRVWLDPSRLASGHCYWTDSPPSPSESKPCLYHHTRSVGVTYCGCF